MLCVVADLVRIDDRVHHLHFFIGEPHKSVTEGIAFSLKMLHRFLCGTN